MKAGSRPRYYRIRRMVQMVREGAETGYPPNSSDFMKEFEVSRRTVARDLDFLRDEERAPLAYDDARHGFLLDGPDLHAAPLPLARIPRKLVSHGVERGEESHGDLCPVALQARGRGRRNFLTPRRLQSRGVRQASVRHRRRRKTEAWGHISRIKN